MFSISSVIIPDLQQIIFEYAIDNRAIIQWNSVVTRKNLGIYIDIIDWNYVSFCITLSESFIREFADKINWVRVPYMGYVLSDSFIREFAHKFDWDILVKNHKLSGSIINEFTNKFHWQYLLNAAISKSLFNKLVNNADWKIVSRYYLNEEEAKLNVKKQKILKSNLNSNPYLEYDVESYNRKFPSVSSDFERFLDKFADKVDWKEISRRMLLTESCIRKFADRVNWKEVSQYITLSESFMEEFTNKLHWEKILQYQSMSLCFFKRFLQLNQFKK